MEYYDRIIIAITACLFGGVLAGALLSISLSSGLAVGALSATPFVYHAIFRNPPVSPTHPQVVGVAAVWHGLLALVLLMAFL